MLKYDAGTNRLLRNMAYCTRWMAILNVYPDVFQVNNFFRAFMVRGQAWGRSSCININTFTINEM
jgi:hypothetical protein